MNAAPSALHASSVKTLGYYQGSSSRLSHRVLPALAGRMSCSRFEERKRPAERAVATVLRRRESNASTQRGGHKISNRNAEVEAVHRTALAIRLIAATGPPRQIQARDHGAQSPAPEPRALRKQKRPAETGRLELINLNEPAFLNLRLRINVTRGFRSYSSHGVTG
jgi:hypothetical protein